jgi:uncharacterized membrane protein YfcA
MNSLLIIAVLAVAIIFSMLGLGGGVLYVPILMQAGISFNSAVATSLLIMLVMSLTAAVVYHANRLIDWKLMLLLEPFSIIGAVLGSYNSNLFPEQVLYIVFAVAMLGSAALTFSSSKTSKKPKKTSFPGIFRHGKKGSHYNVNLWIGIPVSFAAGFVSSIIGIGGGFAKVPLMTLAFGMPTNTAVATSSAMIVLTCLAGFAGHGAIGHVNFKFAGILAVVVFIGAIIGSKISVKTDKRVLNLAFACLQVIIAGWMVFKAVH